MTDLNYLKIGGVNFTLNKGSSILLREHDPVYWPFISEKKYHEFIDNIDVNFKLGNIPETEGLTKIFDTGGSWSMFQKGKFFILVMKPKDFKKPIWVAEFNRDIKEITIYCGSEIMSKENGKKVISNPLHYPLDQLLLMYILSQKEGALIHAAGIKLHGKGFIFPGTSGAGKSTISRQFKTNRDIQVFSDDRMIIRKINGLFFAFGTPWPGEERIALNKSMPLSGIFFLVHSKKNRIRKIKTMEVLEKLFQVTSIPWYEEEILKNALKFCDDLISEIPCFELHFKPDIEVVKFIQEFEVPNVIDTSKK